MNNTKRNHFVPQKYLKAFMNPTNGQIFCKDLKNPERKSRKYFPKTICYEEKLYHIQKKLTENDINFFKFLYLLNEKEGLSQTEKNLIPAIVNFLNIENEKKELANQESIFTFYEENFHPVLDMLLKEDISFYKNNKKKYLIELYESYSYYVLFSFLNSSNKYYSNKDIAENNIKEMTSFLTYIATQIFRTKYFFNYTEKLLEKHFQEPQKKDMLENFGVKIKEINEKDIPIFMTHLQSRIFIKNLIKEYYHPVLVKNKTNKKFITSDNPVVNTYSLNKPKNIQCNDE